MEYASKFNNEVKETEICFANNTQTDEVAVTIDTDEIEVTTFTTSTTQDSTRGRQGDAPGNIYNSEITLEVVK